jgi:cell division protein FtsW (lipid II flippase)
VIVETHKHAEQTSMTRQLLLDVLGLVSLLVGAVGFGLSLFASSRDLAWSVALLGVALSVLCLAGGVTRKWIAASGMLIGGLAFAFSFAMVTWGRV